MCRQVQKKHMDTHTHTSHQDAAESHRQQRHESLLLPALFLKFLEPSCFVKWNYLKPTQRSRIAL